MKKIETILKEELYQLKKIVEETQKRLIGAPIGNLRVRKWNNVLEYYYRNPDANNTNETRHNGRYLKKDEMDFAKKLAQRDYDVQIVRAGQERIKAINTFLKKYDKTSLKEIYSKTNPYRRELIKAVVISDEEYIKRWQSVQYEGKAFLDDAPEIITERGERVRSKSEKIIADKLYALGIPYRYEYPLTLDGNIRMYPDFTILKMPEREEVYLEHFGMMDDINYVDIAMQKLNTYGRNGIYVGVNLFMTYETSKNPLNIRVLSGFLKLL